MDGFGSLVYKLSTSVTASNHLDGVQCFQLSDFIWKSDFFLSFLLETAFLWKSAENVHTWKRNSRFVYKYRPIFFFRKGNEPRLY